MAFQPLHSLKHWSMRTCAMAPQVPKYHGLAMASVPGIMRAADDKPGAALGAPKMVKAANVKDLCD